MNNNRDTFVVHTCFICTSENFESRKNKFIKYEKICIYINAIFK
jgi:hypothetical protein